MIAGKDFLFIKVRKGLMYCHIEIDRCLYLWGVQNQENDAQMCKSQLYICVTILKITEIFYIHMYRTHYLKKKLSKG